MLGLVSRLARGRQGYGAPVDADIEDKDEDDDDEEEVEKAGRPESQGPNRLKQMLEKLCLVSDSLGGLLV